jgi:pimeloyl-ACP methyl ester carboxylesterase
VDRIDLDGRTLRQVFVAVGEAYPKLLERILDDVGELRPEMAIAIDGSILEGGELVREVDADAEIYLVPPIGGGAHVTDPFRDFDVDSGGARLACEEQGEGTTIVALHAGVADRRSWREMAGLLAASSPSYRTVAYDRRGFGTAYYSPESFSHVEDLETVVEAVAPGSVVLLGNSQGGKIALNFALARPDRVDALVLIAPAISGVPDDAVQWTPEPLEAVIEAADTAGNTDEVNRLEAHFWLDGPRQPEGRVGGAARELFLDMNNIALEAGDTGEERPSPPAWDMLAHLDLPVLVVVGEYDEQVAIDLCRLLAERLPQGEFLLLPGVAHIPQLEQPEAVATLVAGFLKGLATTP